MDGYIGSPDGTVVTLTNETIGTIYPHRCVWRECPNQTSGVTFLGLANYVDVIHVGPGAHVPAGTVPCYRCNHCQQRFYRNGLFMRESALMIR